MRHYVLLDKPVCPYFTGKTSLITSHLVSDMLSATPLECVASNLARLGTDIGPCYTAQVDIILENNHGVFNLF